MKNEVIENIKSYYDNIYSSLDTEWRPMGVYEKIIERLGVEKGMRLLDVSCGTGNQIKCAEEKGIEAYGIDISEAVVMLARKKVKCAKRILLADASTLPFKDGYFDLITNFGSLQYYSDQEKAISEMARVVRKGGRFCIVVPNGNFPLFYIKPQLGLRVYGDRIEGRVLKFLEWTKLFNKYGLVVKKIYRERGPGFRTAKTILQFIKRILLKFSLLLPKKFNYQLYFICEKK